MDKLHVGWVRVWNGIVKTSKNTSFKAGSVTKVAVKKKKALYCRITKITIKKLKCHDIIVGRICGK